MTSCRQVVTSCHFSNYVRFGAIRKPDSGRIISKTENLRFLKLLMCVYFRTKFQVSIIILTSLRQRVLLLPSHPKKNPFKSPPRLGLNKKLEATQKLHKRVIIVDSMWWVGKYLKKILQYFDNLNLHKLNFMLSKSCVTFNLIWKYLYSNFIVYKRRKKICLREEKYICSNACLPF